MSKDNSQLYDYNIVLNNDGFLHAQKLIKAGKVSKQSYYLPMTKEYVDAFLLKNDPNDIKKWHLGLNLADFENMDVASAQKYNYNQWVFPFTTDFENLNTAALEAAYMDVSKIPYKKYKKPQEIPLSGIQVIRTLAKQYLQSKADFEIKHERYSTVIEVNFKL